MLLNIRLFLIKVISKIKRKIISLTKTIAPSHLKKKKKIRAYFIDIENVYKKLIFGEKLEHTSYTELSN